MNIFGWKQLDHFLQNVFQKRESLLFWRINIGINSPGSSNLGMIIRDVTISVLRIAGEGGGGVTGHFDLWNDRDKPIRCVSDNLPDVILGKISSIRCAIAQGRIPEHRRARPLGTDLGKKRILLYFDAPSLVFGQMPVQ